MKNFDNSVYPGKKDYDDFVSSLPKNDSELKQDEGLTIAMNSVDIFNKGIPNSDRPECIYYFYHFLKLDMESGNSEEIPERFKDLPEYAISSLYNPMVSNYIKLLDSEKLYEVCQIRGEIMYYHSGLYNYIFNKADLNWNDLSEKIENFLNSEPTIPRTLLGFYLSGLVLNKSNYTRLYEIAEQTWNISTDLDHLIVAWLYLNDTKVIRAYKKNTLPAKDAKKIYNLEQVEKEVEAEFGDNFRGRTTLGKAFQLLSSRGREERKQLSILRDEWIIKIKSQGGLSMMGNDPYVKGYVSYLNAIVCAGTEDWKKAIKELKSALENNFDPSDVLILLIGLLENLKKYDEAADFTQKLIDIESVLDDEKGKKFIKEYLLNFKQVDRNPLWANRIWESKSIENEQNISSIIAEMESDIISARNENVNLRSKGGLELSDKLVSLESSDTALNNSTPFSEVEIDNKLIDVLEFSLEEIEPFNKVKTEKLLKMFQEKINLHDLLSINEDIINIHFGELSDKFDEIVSNFPNTLACIPVAKKKIEYLLSKEKIDFARKLSEHIINKRKNKVLDIYNSIKPLITFYHNHQEWNQEIELISKSRKILLDDEFKQATDNLIEAYLEALANEKSLNNKNRILLEIESENLVDEKLIKIKKEVDAQLNRRKQILTKIGIGVGIAIIIFILVYFLFL